MDNTDVQFLGCGYQRLRQVAQALSLELAIEGYDWQAKAQLAAAKAQPTPRTDFVQTMNRLKLLSEYIHWQFNIVNTSHDGKEQKVRVTLSGNNLKTQALEAITEVFMALSAKFENAKLIFNPDSLELVNASFEFTVFTASEVDL